MSGATGIEWTDTTWNPVRGCSRVSEGCRNCYAEKMAARFSGPGLAFEGFAELHKSSRVPPLYQGLNVETGEVEYSAPRRIPARSRWTGKVELLPNKLLEPLSWRKPQKVFVNSMSDLFHESLSDESIAAVLDVIRRCLSLGLGHTFQVLTKRPERMASVMRRLRFDPGDLNGAPHRTWIAESEDAPGYPLGSGWRGSTGLTNLHLGTSVEDQATANERIPHLLRCPAAVRFLSCEPLLGWVDLQDLVVVDAEDDEGFNGATIDWTGRAASAISAWRPACLSSSSSGVPGSMARSPERGA